MKKIIGSGMICICLSIASVAQAQQGWITLFDGKTFTGWRGYNRSDIPNAWSIEDGAIKINKKDPAATAHSDRGDILFDTKFKNFELELEYKVDKAANSGIFYLAQELAGKPVYHGAPEYQVLDNDNHPDAKQGKDGNRKSGSLYDMIPANPQTSKPHGEWNVVRIRVKDGNVTHFLNGKQVVKYTLWNDAWQTMVKNSKFNGWPEFLTPGGESKSGFIALQDHSDNVWYRNIKVKALK